MKSAYIDKTMISHVLAALMPPNRLACEVCLATGLRIDDVLSLRTAELDRHMTITEEKTHKKKRVTFSQALCDALKAQAGKIYVFQHRDDINRHRTRQAVYMDIKRAAKAFRIKPNLTPHSLRKVYAVELMHKYGDIEKVRRALNHDNDAVTMIYALADILQERRKK